MFYVRVLVCMYNSVLKKWTVNKNFVHQIKDNAITTIKIHGVQLLHYRQRTFAEITETPKLP